MASRRTWTDTDLRCAVSQGRSVRDVVKRLGLKIAGGSCAAIKKAIEREGLDTSHFVKYLPRSQNAVSKRSIEAAFNEGSRATKNTIKRLLKRHNLIQHQCKCGLTDEWQGKKLILQLEHKNGNTNDNRLENLEWLCANCHSQTSTYAGRNRNREAWSDGSKISGIDYSDTRSSPGILKRKVCFDDVKFFYVTCRNFRLTAKHFGISHQSVMNIVKNY
ncbi:MAG: hypothetical protein EOP04_03930 [Proteobacteria bacterium]|nr:MAG: hypothetical protein EOP04_03930 [Pseudomonadota bacterium]